MEGKIDIDVKKIINEGILEHEDDIKETHKEVEDYYDAVEPDEPELTEKESSINFNTGIEKAKETFSKIKGELIGAIGFYRRYPRWFHGLELLNKVGEDEILKKIADVKDHGWRELYDDDLFVEHDMVILNGEIICSCDNDRNCLIDNRPVMEADYDKFKEEIKIMSDENYNTRGDKPKRENDLPLEIRKKINKIRFDYETEDLLKNGEVVSAGDIKLHNIYGDQYFGSASGYGYVEAYDLLEWKKGLRIKKELITKGVLDNGFAKGPDQITIEPNTIVICKGGDFIGDARTWREIYICE